LDFTFEILDPTTINIRFNYGGEWFEFNLFLKQNQWILHPFDASLLGNPDMCRLVVADLLAHKPFQVMLAKERILLSQLRSSIDVSGNEGAERVRGGRFEDEDDVIDNPADSLDDWIRNHTFEEILNIELHGVEDRLRHYQALLQKMFYDNLGPGNVEFDKVQEITRIYKDAAGRLTELIDPDSFLRDRNKDGRRF
jgi:hypothetical protein